MMKVNKCQICKKNKFKLIQGINKNKKFSIYKCLNCGLFFQYPIPNTRDLRNLYNDIYNKKCNFSLAESSFENFNKKQEEKRIKSIEEFVLGGNLLDIGASTGFFISVINKKKKWEAVGVEYSKEAVKIAKEKYNTNILCGEIRNPNIPNNYFDVVTMHSVLEHVPDLSETVQEVNKKLKIGGYFIFNIPNTFSFEYFFYKFLGREFPGFIKEHLNYFNPLNIELLMKNNGFVIKKMTSRHYSKINFSIRPLIGVLTFIPKLFLEYTNIGAKLKKGNIIYVYAKKKKEYD